jgi:hypothetical protein
VERVEYRLYGDSLLSETVGNRREWYALKNDSALWLREETPLLTLTPAESIPVNGFGMSKEISDIHEFTAHGIYSNDIPITEWGKITPMPSITGQLIINNDTIVANLISEKREFHTHIQQGEAPDTITTYQITRHRWYRPGERIPVALQCDIKFLTDSSHVETFSKVYLADIGNKVSHDAESDDNTTAIQKLNEAIAEALTTATVTVAGCQITVGVDSDTLPSNTLFSADIMDSAGILYLHQEPQAVDMGELTVDASSLSYGRYVIAINCNGQTEKRLITL